MILHLKTCDARRLGESVNAATGWKVETWVLHSKGDPGATLAQLELFHDKGRWYLWAGNITTQRTLELGRALATARNKKPAARVRKTGRYTYEGQWDRLCVCGRTLGKHDAEAPHGFGEMDDNPVECNKFRPAK